MRESLPHDVPSWIDPTRETYFITVCAQDRGGYPLLEGETPAELIASVRHRNEVSIWDCRLFVIMPDHVHGLFQFSEHGLAIEKRIAKWKEWTAKSLGIRWQRDFFEHRLRRDESVREKADNIFANLVRAGLTARAEDWAWTFIAG